MAAARRLRRWAATIRGRLLLGLLGVLLTGLIGSSLATSALLVRYLNDRDRDTLQQAAERVEALLADGPLVVDGGPIAAALGAPLGIAALGAGDELLESTGSASVAPEGIAAAAREVGKVVRYEPEGVDVNLLAVRVSTAGLDVVADPGDSPVAVEAVVLTIDADISSAAIRRLVTQQAVTIAVTLAVLAGLTTLVLRVGLRPLQDMADAADEIAAGDRQRRLPTTGGDTETDQLAATVNRAFDARTAAEDKLRVFVADASHELRTPVATISGWLDLHNQGALSRPEDLEQALGRVEAETGRMRLLIEELSLLARLDAGRPLAAEPVEVVALAADIVEDARVVSPDRSIGFVATDARAVVQGDEPRLAQVLRNLLGNAVQHTPPDASVSLSVAVVGDEAGEVVIAVTDAGPGIAPEHVPHLFERFWRADESRSRQAGGSGLGLAIVRAITEAHGGHVRVDSVVGRGTTMSVHLPRATISNST